MTYILTADCECRSGYIRLGEGEYSETIPLDPGMGLGVDVDVNGYVMGVEFLSCEEYADVLDRFGGAIEVPERVTDTSNFHLQLPPHS